jgi:hypothetical protein
MQTTLFQRTATLLVSIAVTFVLFQWVAVGSSAAPDTGTMIVAQPAAQAAAV